jgi:hypothetical protein
MTIKEAVTLFSHHQRSNLRARTVQSYRPLLQRFGGQFWERSFDPLGSDEIFQFLEMLTGDHSKSTRPLSTQGKFLNPDWLLHMVKGKASTYIAMVWG